jgi:hypothetical protein
MAGAYVAKPEADVTPPDVPDGWNPDWPHPGPDPPGYTPEYSLALTAPASLSYDDAGTATLNLLDHTTYATDEPRSGAIAWSAAIGANPVSLRFSGGSEYASSIESSYGDIGDYWGAEPEIEFELTEDDIGSTLVLTAQSTVEGQAVSDTATISIIAPVYTAVFTGEITLHNYDTPSGSDTYDAYLHFYAYDLGIDDVHDEIKLRHHSNTLIMSSAEAVHNEPQLLGSPEFDIISNDNATFSIAVSAEQWDALISANLWIGYWGVDAGAPVDVSSDFVLTASYYRNGDLVATFTKTHNGVATSEVGAEDVFQWIQFTETALVDLTA